MMLYRYLLAALNDTTAYQSESHDLYSSIRINVGLRAQLKIMINSKLIRKSMLQ
jgi:hypothetical protein